MKKLLLTMLCIAGIACSDAGIPDDEQRRLDAALATTPRADSLRQLLASTPRGERAAMAWLIARMPCGDRDTMRLDLLRENVAYACRAREEFPWTKALPDSVFRNEVLPYAVVDEVRDGWRRDLYERFAPRVAGCRDLRAALDTVNRILPGVVGVEYNTLSVVNRLCEGRGGEIYRFFRDTVHSRYMQFLPAVEHVVDKPGFHRPLIVSPDREGARLAEWSVTAKGYGEFLCDVFDVWVVSDVGRTFVQMFDATLAQWCGVPPGVCSMGETCGDALVVEHNGDVYSCDHFVYPEYKLGNIRETPLSEIYRSRKRVDFGLAKRNALPAECLRCKYYFACRGECPKHRFETGSDGCRKNSLCEGLQHWFRHSEPYMEYMRDMLAREQSPAWVMPFARKRMGLM